MRSLLLAVAATLVLAAPAAAAPTWLSPVDLGAETPGTSSSGRVALAPDGTAVAAWAQWTPSAGTWVLQVSRRLPGGGFSPPITVPGSTAVSQLSVGVGIDGSDNATIVWEQAGQIRVVPFLAGAASVGTVQPLAAGQLPVIAVNNGGTAVVAWLDGGSTQVSSAVRPAATGDFGDIKTISQPTQGVSGLDVAVGDAGNAAAIWSRTVAPSSYIEVSERPAGGTFANTGTSISDTVSGNETSPAIVIDATGRPTALWSATTLGVVQFAERAPGDATWSAFAQASQVGDSASSPAAGVAPNGTVVAAWEVGTPGGGLIKSAIRPPGGGGFAEFRELSGPSMNTLAPLVSVGRNGDALIAWGSSMGEAIYAVRRAADGTYGALLRAVTNEIALPGEFINFQQPSIGVDDQGNGIATFLQDTFRNPTNFYRFRAVSYDVAAPTLSATVPPGGTARKPIGMAAAAVDRLTPVSINWAFGDGGLATGGAVSHVFGSAGAFNVTVTATDAVGNATATTRPVLVKAAPPKRIRSAIRITWAVSGRTLYVLRLGVTRVPKGGKVELRCSRRNSSRKCPFKRKASKKRRNGRITLFKEIRAAKVRGKKQRTFRAGQRLEVRITAKGYIGKVARYKLRKGKIPSAKQLCLPVGAKKPRKRC
jgi:hypothetical protein